MEANNAYYFGGKKKTPQILLTSVQRSDSMYHFVLTHSYTMNITYYQLYLKTLSFLIPTLKKKIGKGKMWPEITLN